MNRKPDDVYFMDLARMVATRSTCERRAVGAVLTWRKRVVSTGYNGSAPGEPHCIDVGCQMEDGHCVRTIHAERNAIDWALYHSRVPIECSRVYVTVQPCADCQTLADEHGIEVVFGERYR